MRQRTETEFLSQPEPSIAAPDRIVPAKKPVTVGPSMVFQGYLTGEEDLMVHGRVEGTIDLKQHSVTVGKNGHVKANIIGKVISVEGEVEGNLRGEDKIIIRQSGAVQGDLNAPCVSLEEGCKFKGTVDMEPGNSSQQGVLTDLLQNRFRKIFS